MNLRTLISFVALATSFTTGSAQLPIGNYTKAALEGLGDALSAVECSDDTRSQAQCNFAPFSGTFVCRKFGSIFGNSVEHTMCSQNIVQGLTLGLKEDTCGCCPDENGVPSCPEVCTCVCGEGKVSVDVQVLGFLKFSRCVTNGWASHSTAWGNAVKCSATCESTEGSDGTDGGDVRA